MATMKTPGVYIIEKDAFPPSIVEVATAVPVFIGYTEFARNGGRSLLREPWPISSMAQYVRYFGSRPAAKFNIAQTGPAGVRAAATRAQKASAAATEAQTDATTQAKQAGEKLAGTPGDEGLKKAKAAADAKLAAATDAVASTAAAASAAAAAQQALDDPKAARTALDALVAADAALQKLVPPLVSAAKTAADELAKTPEDAGKKDGKATADHNLKDAQDKAAAGAEKVRLAQEALDGPELTLTKAANAKSKARLQMSKFKFNNKREYMLTRKAGKEGGRQLMYQAMQHFFLNGGGKCYVVSVGDYDADIAADDLIKGLEPLLKEQEPTMVLTPDAVLLDEPDCILLQQQVLMHCGYKMKSRVGILDIWGGDRDPLDEFGPCIDNFRDHLGINQLDYGAAYYPWLHTSLVQAGDIDFRCIEDTDVLASLIKEDLNLNPGATDPKSKQWLEALNDLALDADGWAAKLSKAIDHSDKSDAEKDQAKQALLDPDQRMARITPHQELLHKSVHAISDLYVMIMDEARTLMNVMPPSAAMAGLYTMVDNTRGVWKAPANVSVAAVVAPTVEISHDDQEDLNVTTQGKSINAIRSFIGEGALVWGARTLDGNSGDWKYINVRRTMIMLEESCRLAAKAMVFEPNTANTWVTVKSMIGNFLTSVWKRGGLMGAVPDDAFSVHCGLGETMTPEDVIEGILRVTVLVCMVRPAEFIEITFQQLMPKS